MAVRRFQGENGKYQRDQSDRPASNTWAGIKKVQRGCGDYLNYLKKKNDLFQKLRITKKSQQNRERKKKKKEI